MRQYKTYDIMVRLKTRDDTTSLLHYRGTSRLHLALVILHKYHLITYIQCSKDPNMEWQFFLRASTELQCITNFRVLDHFRAPLPHHQTYTNILVNSHVELSKYTAEQTHFLRSKPIPMNLHKLYQSRPQTMYLPEEITDHWLTQQAPAPILCQT